MKYLVTSCMEVRGFKNGKYSRGGGGKGDGGGGGAMERGAFS